MSLLVTPLTLQHLPLHDKLCVSVPAAQASFTKLKQVHCHMMQQQVSVAMARVACMQQVAPGSQATPRSQLWLIWNTSSALDRL